jgi:hypothetical protein
LLEQPRRPHPPPLERPEITRHACWISHAEEYSRLRFNCHYIM